MDKKMFMISYKDNFSVIEVNNVDRYEGILLKKDNNDNIGELKALSIFSSDDNVSGIYNLKGEKISNYQASFGIRLRGTMIGPSHHYYNNNYIIYKGEQGLGLLDFNGNIVLEGKYDFLQEDNNHHYMASLNGKYGIIDYTGRVLIPFENDQIVDYNMLVKDNKFALIDKNYHLLTDYEIDYNPAWGYSYIQCCGSYNPLYSFDYENRHVISFWKDRESNIGGTTYIIDEKGNVQKFSSLFDIYNNYLYSTEEKDKEIIINTYDKNYTIKNTIKHKIQDNLKLLPRIFTTEPNKIEIIEYVKDEEKVETCYSLESLEKCFCSSSSNSSSLSSYIDEYGVELKKGESLTFKKGNYRVYHKKDKDVVYYHDEKIIETTNKIDDINDTYLVVYTKNKEYKLYKFVDK